MGFEHPVEPGGGGETNSQVIEEVWLLKPGVYMLEAQSGTFVKNAVPPSRFAQVPFGFIFEVATACPADLNDDGAVTAADLAMLFGRWGPCPGCPADLDGSGNVGAFDRALLLGSRGSCK